MSEEETRKHLRLVLGGLSDEPLGIQDLSERLWYKVHSYAVAPLLVRQALDYAVLRGLVRAHENGTTKYGLTQEGEKWLMGHGLKKDLQLAALVDSIALPIIIGVSAAVVVLILRITDERQRKAAVTSQI